MITVNLYYSGTNANARKLYDFTFSFRLRSVYYYGVKQARACNVRCV